MNDDFDAFRPGKGLFYGQRRGKESSEKFVIWKSYYKFAICFVWDGGGV